MSTILPFSRKSMSSVMLAVLGLVAFYLLLWMMSIGSLFADIPDMTNAGIGSDAEYRFWFASKDPGNADWQKFLNDRAANPDKFDADHLSAYEAKAIAQIAKEKNITLDFVNMSKLDETLFLIKILREEKGFKTKNFEPLAKAVIPTTIKVFGGGDLKLGNFNRAYTFQLKPGAISYGSANYTANFLPEIIGGGLQIKFKLIEDKEKEILNQDGVTKEEKAKQIAKLYDTFGLSKAEKKRDGKLEATASPKFSISYPLFYGIFDSPEKAEFKRMIDINDYQVEHKTLNKEGNKIEPLQLEGWDGFPAFNADASSNTFIARIKDVPVVIKDPSNILLITADGRVIKADKFDSITLGDLNNPQFFGVKNISTLKEFIKKLNAPMKTGQNDSAKDYIRLVNSSAKSCAGKI